jgi:CRP/FNR family transcriptional regulator
MEQLAFGNATQKVASIMSILGERFGKQTEKGIQIPISLTQQDIAELIGIARETTSIELNRLMADEIIERVSGMYIIIRPQRLQKLSKLFGK